MSEKVDYGYALNFWRKAWSEETGRPREEFDDWFIADADPPVRTLSYLGAAQEGTPEWLHQKRLETFIDMLNACAAGVFGGSREAD